MDLNMDYAMDYHLLNYYNLDSIQSHSHLNPFYYLRKKREINHNNKILMLMFTLIVEYGFESDGLRPAILKRSLCLNYKFLNK